MQGNESQISEKSQEGKEAKGNTWPWQVFQSATNNNNLLRCEMLI